jgi:hypothetical protein
LISVETKAVTEGAKEIAEDDISNRGAVVGRSMERSGAWFLTEQSHVVLQQSMGPPEGITMGAQEGIKTADACAAGAKASIIPTTTMRVRFVKFSMFILYHTKLDCIVPAENKTFGADINLFILPEAQFLESFGADLDLDDIPPLGLEL